LYLLPWHQIFVAFWCRARDPDVSVISLQSSSRASFAVWKKTHSECGVKTPQTVATQERDVNQELTDGSGESRVQERNV
ncbi:unnamed protein product, partial [marine sediment metagenome]